MTKVIKVNQDELNKVSTEIKKKSNQIYDTYKKQVRKVLELSSECFTASGIDTNLILDTFDSTYKELNDKMNNIVEMLNNHVLQDYTDLNEQLLRKNSLEALHSASKIVTEVLDMNDDCYIYNVLYICKDIAKKQHINFNDWRNRWKIKRRTKNRTILNMG